MKPVDDFFCEELFAVGHSLPTFWCVPPQNVWIIRGKKWSNWVKAIVREVSNALCKVQLESGEIIHNVSLLETNCHCVIRPDDFAESSDKVPLLFHHIRWRTKIADIVDIINTFRIKTSTEEMLKEAMKHENLPVIKWLVQVGIRNNYDWTSIVAGEDGGSLLHFAVLQPLSSIRQLVSALPKESLKQLVPVLDKRGRTFLHVAVARGELALMFYVNGQLSDETLIQLLVDTDKNIDGQELNIVEWSDNDGNTVTDDDFLCHYLAFKDKFELFPLTETCSDDEFLNRILEDNDENLFSFPKHVRSRLHELFYKYLKNGDVDVIKALTERFALSLQECDGDLLRDVIAGPLEYTIHNFVTAGTTVGHLEMKCLAAIDVKRWSPEKQSFDEFLLACREKNHISKLETRFAYTACKLPTSDVDGIKLESFCTAMYRNCDNILEHWDGVRVEERFQMFMWLHKEKQLPLPPVDVFVYHRQLRLLYKLLDSEVYQLASRGASSSGSSIRALDSYNIGDAENLCNLASLRQDVHMIDWLLRSTLVQDMTCSLGHRTLLSYAIESEKAIVVKYLCANWASVYRLTTNSSYLALAEDLRIKNAAIIEILLEYIPIRSATLWKGLSAVINDTMPYEAITMTAEILDLIESAPILLPSY